MHGAIAISNAGALLSTRSTGLRETRSLLFNIRLNKKKFLQSLRTSDAKNFWKAIKLLTKQDSTVPTLVYNGLTFEANSDKENINKYFHDCFK